MGFTESDIHGGLDDFKLNSQYLAQLNHNKKSALCDDAQIHSSAKNLSPNSTKGEDMMDFTTMLEAMDEILDQTKAEEIPSNGMMAQSIEPGSDDMSDLLAKLDQLFTPILVMQKMEQSIADESNNELAESGTLTEKTMINFDDADRMAQLQSVCALLLAQKKNTENWQMFKKAAAIKNQSKINIQKEEYEEAKQLAQQYLIKVSTTNNSAVARDAAKELLPQTQH